METSRRGLFDGVLRVGEVALVLLGGDAGLRHGLVQRGLGLLQRGLLLLKLLFGAAGIEADHGLALLDDGSPDGASQAMRSWGTMGA